MPRQNDLAKTAYDSLPPQAFSLLLAWYRAHKRAMPWREDPTPYHVWISEIMLQQTRIEAVLPYYERFLAAFPTVQSLAEAEEDRVLKAWEGLGYYSRARNLKKAAKEIVQTYGGTLPDSAAQLRKLPGIGDYTAGAIASIAYGKSEPAVDGNVLRVFTRLTACKDDIMQPATRRAVTESLRSIYPTGRDAGDLTQGIMELGETVCLPNALPRCAECPLASLCLAYRENAVLQYPVKSPKKERRVLQKTVFLLSESGRFALRKRQEKGLLAGLWELPNTEGRLSPEEAAAFLQKEGLRVLSIAPCGEAKHIFTHVEWQMIGYRVECAAPQNGFLWKTAAEIAEGYAIPTAFAFYKKRLTE